MTTPHISLTLLSLAAGLTVAGSQWFIWAYAPVEQTMGLIQKILYIHIPMSWWAMISFLVVCMASIRFLHRPEPRHDRLAQASAEVGMLCCALTLVTGSLWARYSWNVWWTWDPRLTTALVMFFVYAAYLLIRGIDMTFRRKGTVCAVLGILAFLDVPLVFASARLWRSIHPAIFASQGSSLEPEMRTTVIACVTSWAFLWLALILTRQRQLEIRDRLFILTLRQET
ncbi:heme exporter protein C [Desulfovibrionales bacterium]